VVIRCIVIACLSASAAAPLSAQQSGTWELSTQFMASPSGSTPNSVFGGQAIGVSQTALSLRATTDLVRLGPLRLRYSAQLLPVMVLSNVEAYQRIVEPTVTTYVIGGKARATGIGIVPLGLDLAADLGARVRVQAGVGIGITRFSQHVPVAGGRQRNFSAEWDGTLMIRAWRQHSAQIGVRWKHISNGLTAYENPGIDNRMIFAGFSWRVRAPR
jgi:Lipid A 3-O-deacylase (PagL)